MEQQELEQHHQLKDQLKKEVSAFFKERKVDQNTAVEVLAEMIVNIFIFRQMANVDMPMENELNNVLVNMSQGAHRVFAKVREDIIKQES